MLSAIAERISYIWGLIKQIWNIFVAIFNISIKIINFISDAVYFIVYFFKTLINYIYKAFDNIFSDPLFDSINNWLSQLSTYIWGFRTTTLVALITIAFFLIIYWFIMRLIKGNINYNSAVKQLDKQHKQLKKW